MAGKTPPDRDLFDGDGFDRSLGEARSPLNIYKETLAAGNRYLAEQFDMGRGRTGAQTDLADRSAAAAGLAEYH